MDYRRRDPAAGGTLRHRDADNRAGLTDRQIYRYDTSEGNPGAR